MDPDLHPYQHQPLPALDYIRILVLEAGSGDDVIRCRIETVPLEDAKCQYEAISYAWGEAGNEIDIICDGKMISIQPNLHDALRTFRRTDEPRSIIWADALRINQRDHTEKGYQVRRMGKIYEMASRVLCWVGKDEDQVAESCFKLVKEATRRLGQQWRKGWTFENLINDLKLPEMVSHDDPESWHAFKHLLSLPWFERLWVVQEAGLSRECTLYWGDHSIEFYEVIELAAWFAYSVHAPRLEGEARTGRPPSMSFWIYNAQFYPREKQLYVDLLFFARTPKVSDQRDVVYSSLGSPLALDQQGRLMVEPDYRESIDSLHIRTALALLSNTREAPHVFSRIIHDRPLEMSDEAYPTWVPRWFTFSPGCTHHIPLTYTYEYRMNPYQAGGRHSQFDVKLEQGNIISLPGMIFDSVNWKSFTLKLGSLRSDIQKWEPRFQDSKLSAIETIWLELLHKSELSPDELAQKLGMIFARGRPSSSNHINNFLAYCEILRSLVGSEKPSPFPLPSSDCAAASDGEWAVTRCRERCLAYTDGGKLALMASVTEIGDVCSIIRGVDVPIILRKTSRGTYKLTGEAYVDGAMEGELMRASDSRVDWEMLRIE